MFLFRLAYLGGFLRSLLQHPAEEFVELTLIRFHDASLARPHVSNVREHSKYFLNLSSRKQFRICDYIQYLQENILAEITLVLNESLVESVTQIVNV